jgi:hypothetical protein
VDDEEEEEEEERELSSPPLPLLPEDPVENCALGDAEIINTGASAAARRVNASGEYEFGGALDEERGEKEDARKIETFRGIHAGRKHFAALSMHIKVRINIFCIGYK